MVLYGFVFFQGFKDSGSLYFECYIEESGAEGETSAEVCFHVVLLSKCTIDCILYISNHCHIIMQSNVGIFHCFMKTILIFHNSLLVLSPIPILLIF